MNSLKLPLVFQIQNEKIVKLGRKCTYTEPASPSAASPLLLLLLLFPAPIGTRIESMYIACGSNCKPFESLLYHMFFKNSPVAQWIHEGTKSQNQSL